MARCPSLQLHLPHLRRPSTAIVLVMVGHLLHRPHPQAAAGQQHQTARPELVAACLRLRPRREGRPRQMPSRENPRLRKNQHHPGRDLMHHHRCRTPGNTPTWRPLRGVHQRRLLRARRLPRDRPRHPWTAMKTRVTNSACLPRSPASAITMRPRRRRLEARCRLRLRETHPLRLHFHHHCRQRYQARAHHLCHPHRRDLFRYLHRGMCPLPPQLQLREHLCRRLYQNQVRHHHLLCQAQAHHHHLPYRAQAHRRRHLYQAPMRRRHYLFRAPMHHRRRRYQAQVHRPHRRRRRRCQLRLEEPRHHLLHLHLLQGVQEAHLRHHHRRLRRPLTETADTGLAYLLRLCLSPIQADLPCSATFRKLAVSPH